MRRALACLVLLVLAAVTPGAVLAQEPSPSPGSCPGVLQPRLIRYERGRVTDDDEHTPLNLRATPGTAGEVVVRMDPGDVFFVLEGPRCSGVYAWYRVRYGELNGWIAEGRGTQYYAEPYLPG